MLLALVSGMVELIKVTFEFVLDAVNLKALQSFYHILHVLHLVLKLTSFLGIFA
jgi:hypothetical protein